MQIENKIYLKQPLPGFAFLNFVGFAELKIFIASPKRFSIDVPRIPFFGLNNCDRIPRFLAIIFVPLNN
jgi:hypothetical protein